MAVRTRILIRLRSPLRHAAEHRHDQVVGLVVGVDRAADLGHPQRHAVVREQREGVAELVAVERPLRLPDHDGVESAVAGRPARRAALLAWGRRCQGMERDLSTSKNSATICPPCGSIRCLARVSCQAREDSGSWLSSVDTRPQNAKSWSLGHGHRSPFVVAAARSGRWALSRIRSRARAAAGVSAGGSSGSITRTGLRLVP